LKVETGADDVIVHFIQTAIVATVTSVVQPVVELLPWYSKWFNHSNIIYLLIDLKFIYSEVTRVGANICVGDSPILGLSHCLPFDKSLPKNIHWFGLVSIYIQ